MGENTSQGDNLEIRKRAFERKARQATHQILFYLGLYYRPITLWKRDTHPRTDKVLKDDAGLVLIRIKALVSSVGYQDDQNIAVESWKTLRQKIESCQCLWPYQEESGEQLKEEDETDKKLKELRDICNKILQDTKPKDPNTLLMHLLNKGRIQIFRWLTEILIGGAALFLLFIFPQVSGLVYQTGWYTFIPGILFAIPALIAHWLGRWRNKQGQQYWWDFGGQPFRSGAARPPERGFGRYAESSRIPFALTVRIFINFLVYFVALVVSLLLTYLVASKLDMILFTVAMILALLFVLYGVAQLLDFWDYYDCSPVRMFFLVILLLALVGINTYKLWLAPLFLWSFFTVSLFLLLWRVSRNNRIRQEKSLKASARANAQGIAVTAALLIMALLVTNIVITQFGEPWSDNGQSFSRLAENEWPKSVQKLSQTRDDPVVVMAASGGGSRAAIYTAHTLLMLHEEEFSHIGCNLQAISSVSGGSLANAVYVSLRRGKSCGPDLHPQFQGEEGLLKKVSGDFLQPTIYGAINGTLFGLFGAGGRSEGIEDAWRKIGLGVDLVELVQDWQNALDVYPPFPLPLFNSTSLETHRVVLSPLKKEFYTDPVVSASAREANLYDRLRTRYIGFSEEVKEPTWVYYRDGIYGLEDLLPNYSPDLAQCVRASANFPVGFPLVNVESKQSLFFSPNLDRRARGDKAAKDSIYLSDGGVLSNSGVFSLYHLLRKKLPNLNERGVLVIIVDASAMQDYKEPTRIEGLFGAIRSQEPIGQSLHRRMLESLKNMYGERLQVVQIDLIPTKATNVETTWTLSEERQKSLERQFLARRPEFEKDLKAAWYVLVGEEGEDPTRYLERPPVD